jgi:hypothetical protein
MDRSVAARSLELREETELLSEESHTLALQSGIARARSRETLLSLRAALVEARLGRENDTEPLPPAA